MDLHEAQEILYKNGFLIENLEDKINNAKNFNRKLAFDLLFEALKRDYNKVTMDIEKYWEDRKSQRAIYELKVGKKPYSIVVYFYDETKVFSVEIIDDSLFEDIDKDQFSIKTVEGVVNTSMDFIHEVLDRRE